MKKIQIEKLREFNTLIIKEKLKRELIPIKEYSIYKKNSQIKICIKYKNHFSRTTSVLFSIKIDGSWFINTKYKKIKYDQNYSVKKIFREVEGDMIKDIKLPKKKYNKYPNINLNLFNKVILKELKMFKLTNNQRITLTRAHSYFENHLLIIRRDKNIEISEDKERLRLKVFKKEKTLIKKDIKRITEILKELE